MEQIPLSEMPRQRPLQPLQRSTDTPHLSPATLRSSPRAMGYGAFAVSEAPQDMYTYLMGQLGRQVTAHFMAGEHNMVEVQGQLRKLGRNFMVIQEAQSGDHISCDLYSLRFIRIQQGGTP